MPQTLNAPPGVAVTAVVTEPLTGFFDQGTFTFTAVSLDDLAGQIAAGASDKRVAKETLQAIQDVRGSLATGGDVGTALQKLQTKVEDIPRAIAKDSNSTKMKQAITEVAQRIQQLAGDEGFDFSQLVKKGIEEAPSLKTIRKKTDEVKGATEVLQLLMEHKLGGIDDPVVHVTFQ